MNRLKYFIIIIVSSMFGFYIGAKANKEPRIYQTSEFQVRVPAGDLLLEILCKEHDISIEDVNDFYIISCPKCIYGGARIQSSSSGSLYYGFHIAYPKLEKLKPNESVVIDGRLSRTYCNKCLYPIGTDWNIITR